MSGLKLRHPKDHKEAARRKLGVGRQEKENPRVTLACIQNRKDGRPKS